MMHRDRFTSRTILIAGHRLPRLVCGLLMAIVGLWIVSDWASHPGRSASAQESDESETETSPPAQPLDELEVPWYDSERAEIRPVPLNPLGDNTAASRGSNWIAQPPVPPPLTNSGPSTSGVGSFLTQAFSGLMWILIAVVVITLVAVTIWILMRTESKSQRKGQDRRRQILDLDNTRVELLPFDVNAVKGDLLDQARAARAAGQLRQAIVLLFAYMLLKLERHGWLFLARGKTNRNYLRELRSTPVLHGVVEGVVVTFEDAFFGDLEPDPKEFDRCWNELDDFHRIVEAKTP